MNRTPIFPYSYQNWVEAVNRVMISGYTIIMSFVMHAMGQCMSEWWIIHYILHHKLVWQLQL